MLQARDPGSWGPGAGVSSGAAGVPRAGGCAVRAGGELACHPRRAPPPRPPAQAPAPTRPGPCPPAGLPSRPPSRPPGSSPSRLLHKRTLRFLVLNPQPPPQAAGQARGGRGPDQAPAGGGATGPPPLVGAYCFVFFSPGGGTKGRGAPPPGPPWTPRACAGSARPAALLALARCGPIPPPAPFFQTWTYLYICMYLLPFDLPQVRPGRPDPG